MSTPIASRDRRAVRHEHLVLEGREEYKVPIASSTPDPVGLLPTRAPRECRRNAVDVRTGCPDPTSPVERTVIPPRPRAA